MSFRFLDHGQLIDNELELVSPDLRWADELLESAAHPMCGADPAASGIDRKWIAEFLKNAPRGHSPASDRHSRVPAYHFWMRLNPQSSPPLPIAGHIGLRIGNSRDLDMYYGHIGYNVYSPARGRHLAARACHLLLPLARAHGMQTLWITCNPENTASRRTCERVGATFVEIVDVPPSCSLFARGDKQKCRYRVDLASAQVKLGQNLFPSQL